MKKHIKTLNFGKRVIRINEKLYNNADYYLVHTTLNNDGIGNYAIVNKEFEELIPFDKNKVLFSLYIIDDKRFIATFIKTKEISLNKMKCIYEFYEIEGNKVKFHILSDSEIHHINNKIIGEEYTKDEFGNIKSTDTFIYDFRTKNQTNLLDTEFKEIINEEKIILYDQKNNGYFIYDINTGSRLSSYYSYITGIYDKEHEKMYHMNFFPANGSVIEKRKVREKQILKVIIASVNIPELDINSKSGKKYELITYLDTNLNYLTPIYDTLNNIVINPFALDFDLENVKKEFLNCALQKNKNREDFLNLVRSKIE